MPGRYIASIGDPLSRDARLAYASARLWARMDILRAPDDDPYAGVRLDLSWLAGLLDGLAEDGLAADSVALLQQARTTDDYGRLLTQVLALTEASARPRSEWPALSRLLGPQMLSELLGVSAATLEGYAEDWRGTPGDVADRLHFLALLVADLAGAYNELGIRRWFERPRTLLGGQAPQDLLGDGFTVDGSGAEQLRSLVWSMNAGGAS